PVERRARAGCAHGAAYGVAGHVPGELVTDFAPACRCNPRKCERLPAETRCLDTHRVVAHASRPSHGLERLLERELAIDDSRFEWHAPLPASCYVPRHDPQVYLAHRRPVRFVRDRHTHVSVRLPVAEIEVVRHDA